MVHHKNQHFKKWNDYKTHLIENSTEFQQNTITGYHYTVNPSDCQSTLLVLKTLQQNSSTLDLTTTIHDVYSLINKQLPESTILQIRLGHKLLLLGWIDWFINRFKLEVQRKIAIRLRSLTENEKEFLMFCARNKSIIFCTCCKIYH